MLIYGTSHFLNISDCSFDNMNYYSKNDMEFAAISLAFYINFNIVKSRFERLNSISDGPV